MILKKLILTLIGLSISPLLAAEDFRIQDFPWTDIKEFECLIGSSSNINSGYDNNTNFSSSSTNKREEKNFNYSLSLSPDFKYQFRTLKNEFIVRLPIETQYYRRYSKESRHWDNSDNSSSNIDEYSTTELNLSSTLDIAYAHFFLNSPFFIFNEFHFDGETRFRHEVTKWYDKNSNSYSDYLQNTNSEKYGVDTSNAVHIGMGRLIDGKFAYQAIHLINDLRDAQLLLNEPKFTELAELSQIIAREQTKFIFDQRIKTSNALKNILRYLVKHELIEFQNIDSFIVVDDYFRNAIDKSRLFGNKLSIFTKINLDLINHEKYTQEPDTTDYKREEHIIFSPSFGVGHHYELPINTKWQFGINSIFNWTPKSSDNFLGTTDRQYITFQNNTHIDYYFNTRWSASLSFNMFAHFDMQPFIWPYTLSYDQELFEERQPLTINADISLYSDYQLNPNLQFSVSASYSIDYSDEISRRIYGDYSPTSRQLSLDEINRFIDDNSAEITRYWNFKIHFTYRLF